jgi:TatD DNase family protein
MIRFVDTHTHIDGEEFAEDREAVIARAQEAGVSKMFVPAIDLPSSQRILRLCEHYPKVLYPMVGLHPEEVRADYQEVLAELHALLPVTQNGSQDDSQQGTENSLSLLAIGEVGLDYYWSREFEREQLEAFETQVQWSVETRLPLMIHCRKAQNELVHIIKRYERELPGGVFHCFTGNEHEAEELLQFDRFVLGIGGVSTFKKSHLPEVLPAVVPLDRLVLETDSPYMAPVPHRGQRNEPAFVKEVLLKLAESYGVTPEVIAEQTNRNVERVFGVKL